MSYAIIGFGNIGRALAKTFARKGIPESFASDAAAIGPTIIPKTLAEAIRAEIIFWLSVSRRSGCRESPPQLPGVRPSSM
jgi:predicted dinucleotide-binding enzyme